MHRRVPWLLLLAAVAGAAALAALGEVERSAPRAQATVDLGGVSIAVDYGRAAAKGRKVFGALVPYDRVWRLGADEATRLTTDGDLVIGRVTVPAGRYALFALPSLGRWKLIINRVADQWGAYNYDPRQDVGRVDMALEMAETPTDPLTLELLPSAERAAVLRIRWERVVATVPIAVAEAGPPAPGGRP